MKKIILLGCLCVLPLSALARENWKAFVRYDKQSAKAALSKQLEKYAQVDSHAALQTDHSPSTKQQLSFAKAIAKDFKQLGAAQVQVSKHGIVTASIPATSTTAMPTLALVAHLDIPPQARAQRPQLHDKYTKGNIVLNKESQLALTENNSPQLLRAHGHDFLTSDGTAAFGADSKAGLAILITLADYILGNPSLQHGPIKLVVLPDAPSHAGAEALDISALQADFAIVLDGTDIGEITTGNFSGRSFTVTFDGRRDIPLGQAISTSFADNLLMASDFHTLLPRHFRPESTSGKQGYITIDNIFTQGNRSTLTGHIRAFTTPDIENLTQQVTQAFNTIKAMYPKRTGAELTFQDQFHNAQPQIPLSWVVLLEKTMKAQDIQPKRISVRNNADFAVLTNRGLPAVSLFTGVFHGGEPLEYTDIDIMEAALRTLLELVTSSPESFPARS